MPDTTNTYVAMATTGGAENDDEEEEKKDPLDADTYGAAMFSLVEDLTDLCGGVNRDSRPLSLNVIRLIYVVFVLMGNYFLQFGMLFFIKAYVLDPAKVVQEQMIEDEIADGGRVKVLLTEQPLFLFTVLYLWSLTILIQFRALERFYRAVNGLPFAPDLSRMVNHEEDDEGEIEYEIKGLTKTLWSIVMVLIVLPKALIVIGLFTLGFEWLASTESPADLILNALALEFVVNIDEQLFEALLPKCIIDQIDKATLTKNVTKFTDDEAGKAKSEAKDIKEEWSAFKRGIIYYFLPIIISGGYIVYSQKALVAQFGKGH